VSLKNIWIFNGYHDLIKDVQVVSNYVVLHKDILFGLSAELIKKSQIPRSLGTRSDWKCFAPRMLFVFGSARGWAKRTHPHTRTQK